ncbi:MAG: hypothetical protein EXS36_19260 [Pedosphaera sp.]|nr:hypothetical protein [Pedosphaera sp.]
MLQDSSATFFVILNGPWPIQWNKNGKPISGATATSYTTPPVTPANAADVYTAEIVGCEVTNPVKATIFTPAAVKSIALNFHGGGANGAPTDLNPTDIAGLQPQAYWNNLAGGSGDSDSQATPGLLYSDNQPSTVTVTWASSGEWGSGTGSASSTQRLLNGLLQSAPATPGLITFNNVPAGEHTVIVYTVGIPLQFQDADYTVTGLTASTVYTTVMNADQYNPAPGFFRGTSTDPKARTLASFVRFDKVKAAADGSITVGWTTITTGFDRGAPVNAVQLVLNAPPAGNPPVITLNPQPTVTIAGGKIDLSVTATGDNLTYQWRKGGKNLSDGGHVSGATTAKLTINAFSAEDEAVYNVAVFNAAGSALSKNVSAGLSTYKIDDALAAYFKFDETSGSSAANAAAGGKAGEVTGSAAWGAAKIANGLTLDGSTYLTLPTYTKAGRELSGSAWVKVNAGASGNIAIARNAERALGLGLGVGPGTPAGQFELSLVAPNLDDPTEEHLSVAIGAGPNIARATDPTPFKLGNLQHVAFSADGAQLRLYVSGVEVASRDYSAAINPPDIQYLTVGAWLMKEPDTANLILDDTNPNTLTGQVDDLALWNRGISAEEVGLIYTAGSAGKALSTVVETPPVVITGASLLGADVVAGPYTADATGVVNAAAKTITVPVGKPNRYFRVSGSAKITSVALQGANIVITYQ